MKKYFNYNGRFFADDERVLPKDDRSYRYGDGLFETMKIKNGNILLEGYHFERLVSGLDILKFEIPAFFTRKEIGDLIRGLCKKNNCPELARVRLSVSRGSGGLYDSDNKLSYLIECWPLEPNGFNERGLVIDIFPDARKSIDKFSNLKSASYLPYVMAAVWAKENKLDDALIQNQHGRICDASIANIFWVKGENIFTPPLTEGCVAGVMRKRMLDLGKDIEEKKMAENDLVNADEVFLTNAISGLRWVKQFRDKIYDNKVTQDLYVQLNQTISS